ncbi:hypothetical protein MHBO_001645 [Bonamia ostreae]|uniref:Sm domain-containing protein n=1 Tax=Bonamia ostreae TaxID=126728 RepID=A0ABV2AJQ5_9EUKA
MAETKKLDENSKLSLTEEINSFLGKTAKIRMADQRVLTGKIFCIDGFGNIILTNAIQSKKSSISNKITYKSQRISKLYANIDKMTKIEIKNF